LDVSGSMNALVGNQRGQRGDSRLTLAKAALNSLLPRLQADDRFGLATFTNTGSVLQNLAPVGQLDVPALQAKVNALWAFGGTTIPAGMQAAVDICASAESLPGRRHRRLLFLTDMQSDAKELSSMIAEQATQGLFVSFVGIGMGYNAALAEEVTKHPGANYFSITKQDEMQQVIVDHFQWNFFPVAFNVEVSLQSTSLDFVEVFGTAFDSREGPSQASWHPNAHGFYPAEFKILAKSLLMCTHRLGVRLPTPALATVLNFVSPASSTIIRVDSAFPSAVGPDGSIKGGLVLMRVRPKPGSASAAARLLLRYSAQDKEMSSCVDVTVHSAEAALTKGLMLQRYVAACRHYLKLADDHGENRDELKSALQSLAALLAELDALPPGEAEELGPVPDDLRAFHALALEADTN